MPAISNPNSLASSTSRRRPADSSTVSPRNSRVRLCIRVAGLWRPKVRRMRDLLRTAARGVLGAMAMTGVRRITVGLGLVQKLPPEEIATEGVPALLAQVAPEHRETAIELLHWGSALWAGWGSASFRLAFADAAGGRGLRPRDPGRLRSRCGPVARDWQEGAGYLGAVRPGRGPRPLRNRPRRRERRPAQRLIVRAGDWGCP